MRRSEFRLGSHTIRPAVDEIGTERIESKAMEVLLALVNAAPDPITPQELLEQVWPDSIVVDNVVHKAVAQLRRALGDDAQNPRYIETIPRRGYRLIAQVESAVRAIPEPLDSVEHRPKILKRGPRFAIAIAAILGITVAGIWWAEFGVQKDTLETVGELESLVPDDVEASRNSIAVLPFDNFSSSPENAFFAAGMQEDILNSLAHIPELLVTSRTSTTRYVDSDLSLPQVAAEMNVAYIIEGSVRRIDEDIRISVQLIEAANDTHVWSQNFDRTVQDVFAIQAEVAERVAQQLQLRIVDEWRGQKPTDSVVAYDLFLRGRQLASEFSTSSLERALNLYESAIEVDPGFADAYAGKAAALAQKVHYYPSQWHELRDPAFAAAEKALELDPESAEANLGMGSLLTMPSEARYGEAVPYLERAVAKNPNDTLSRFYLFVAYSFLQRKDEMSEQGYEIYRRDPFSTRGNMAMAFVLAYESKPDETRMHLNRALQSDDLAPYWLWIAGRGSWWAGDYHAAAHHLHGALELDPTYAWAHYELILVFMLLGDHETADRWIRKYEAIPSAVGVERWRLSWYRNENQLDDYVAYADAWLERSPENPSAQLAVASALAFRAEDSYRRGDSETWRTIAEDLLEEELAGLRGPDGDINVATWNATAVMNAATAAARLGEKSLAEDLYRRLLRLHDSQEISLHWRHLEVAMAKAALGRSQEAVEHLEAYFDAGFGYGLNVGRVVNDTHGIFHELPALAAERGIRSKMIERSATTIRRIREDFPALFED